MFQQEKCELLALTSRIAVHPRDLIVIVIVLVRGLIIIVLVPDLVTTKTAEDRDHTQEVAADRDVVSHDRMCICVWRDSYCFVHSDKLHMNPSLQQPIKTLTIGRNCEQLMDIS